MTSTNNPVKINLLEIAETNYRDKKYQNYQEWIDELKEIYDFFYVYFDYIISDINHHYYNAFYQGKLVSMYYNRYDLEQTGKFSKEDED